MINDNGIDGESGFPHGPSRQVDPQLASIRARIRGRLQAEVGEIEYRNWLRQMTLIGVDGDEVTVHLPTRFLRDWVRTHYGNRLDALWQAESPTIRRVDIRVGTGVRGTGLAESVVPALTPLAASLGLGAALANAGTPRSDDRLPDLGILDPRYTFANFVVGKPNAFAQACAQRVAEHPASPGFNPLFLYGGVGLGKTHLMHAIGNQIMRNNPSAKVLYLH